MGRGFITDVDGLFQWSSGSSISRSEAFALEKGETYYRRYARFSQNMMMRLGRGWVLTKAFFTDARS
jgi:hypothetical protein